MEHFWTGFEKRAIIKPHLMAKAKDIFKTMASAVSRAASKIPKPSMPKFVHEVKLSDKDLNRLEKIVQKSKLTHDLTPKASKELKDIATHAAEKAEEVKRFKPKDLIIPAVVGSAGIGAGTLMGRRMASKIIGKTVGEEDRDPYRTNTSNVGYRS